MNGYRKPLLLLILLWPVLAFGAGTVSWLQGVSAVSPLNLPSTGVIIDNPGCVNIRDASGTAIGVMCLPSTDILTFDDTTNLEGFLFDSNGIFKLNDTLHILEQASKETSVAGYGQVFVKTASPNTLHFVNDVGTEIELGAAGGTVLVNDLSPQLGGFLDMNQEDIISTAQTRTLAMTDGVVTGIFPAVEPGIPDDWRFNSAASWFTETRNTGVYLGEHANVGTAEAVAGAAIGDYYYNTTSKTYENLDDLAGTDTEIFRAGSAEFPAMPVFVSRTAKLVDILDGKDGLIWARVEGNASDLLNNNGTMGAVTYRNGVMAVASTTGVFIVDFKDGGTLRFYTATNVSAYKGTWAQRNAGSGYAVLTTDSILSVTVKAVAIGDASKDYGFDDWGVPRQYIAVGTDSTNGVSVIHPNGKVYDITGASAAVQTIDFNDFNELIGTFSAAGEVGIWNIPFRDVAHTTKIRRMLTIEQLPTADNAPIINHASGNVAIEKILHDRMVAIGLGTAKATIVDFDKYSATGTDNYQDSLPTYIGYDSVLTEHFISPLVDRLVTASLGTEIGTGNLVEGSNLVTNGADWTGATGTTPPNSWTTTGSTATYTISSGALIIDRNAEATDSAADITQTLTTVGSKAYLLRISIDARSNSVVVTVQGTETTYTSTGIKFIPFVADDTTTEVRIRTDANDGATATIDDVEANLATQDRSQLNTNHAKINGTITRAAYDSGDVVMHSGATGANSNTGAYWEVGYDVFATDGVLFAGWIDRNNATTQFLMSNRSLDGSDDPIVGNGSVAGDGTGMYVDGSINRIRIRDDTGAAVVTTDISTALAAGLHHIIIILSSTDFYVYVDGELDQVTASVTLTAPVDAITYIHPDSMALPRVGGIDRKGTADYYRWVYAKERRLFNNGAKGSLQGTGNVVDIAVDPIRNEYTILQTDHRTTFDMDGIVASDAAVSNTGVSVSTYDGDISVLDGANLILTTRARSVSNSLVSADRVREKRTIEFDSLIEADNRVFGTSFADLPVTGGDTVGGALLDWDGSEGTTATVITDAIATMFDDEAGSYLLSLTVANRSAGTITAQFSGTTGTARSTNATFTQTLVYDPAASADDNYQLTPASSFDGQVSDYRIRRVGIPFWLDQGWRPETVYLDGTKSRPDTPDLVRGYAVTRRFDGAYGVKATSDTWLTLSAEVVSQ